jgi:hypothetical protein
MIAWELKTATQAIEQGREPGLLTEGELWPEHIIEVKPVGVTGGEIVWEWHIWDHLVQDFDSTKSNFGVITEHPELIDINFTRTGEADWIHANAIDYNAALDQIILAAPRFNEFWVIDHSTTTDEAAGHTGGDRGKGGDLLYRWGNPAAYGLGSTTDQRLFGVHDVHWIESNRPRAGDIMFFNNGNGRPEGTFSSIDIIEPPVNSAGDYSLEAGLAFGPAEPDWSYRADVATDFHARFLSSAQRLTNGNTLVCDGPKGTFSEINSAGELVWKYVSPVTNQGPLRQGDFIPLMNNNRAQANLVFRAARYAPEFPGLAGRDLTPGDPLELDAITGIENTSASVPTEFALSQNYPNPFNPSTTIGYTVKEASPVRLTVYDLLGKQVALLVDEAKNPGRYEVMFGPDDLASGVYVYRFTAGEFVATRKMLMIK